MIDINQPVKQGEDLVINESGESHLGTYAEFQEKAAEGLIAGVHLDKAVAQSILDGVPDTSESKPQRNAKGHFIKVKELDVQEDTTPEATPEATEVPVVEAPVEAPAAPAEVPTEAPAEAPEATPAE